MKYSKNMLLTCEGSINNELVSLWGLTKEEIMDESSSEQKSWIYVKTRERSSTAGQWEIQQTTTF